MMDITTVKFIDNSAAQNDEGRYISVHVDTKRAVESWRDSIFSYEWITSAGEIKNINDLSEHEKPKRALIEEKINANQPIEKPILGIGLKDNVEIGSGRALFLTLTALGARVIPVHIPKSNESDFKDFLADVD